MSVKDANSNGEKLMGMFICSDCDKLCDSKDGESMICNNCGKGYCSKCSEMRFVTFMSVECCICRGKKNRAKVEVTDDNN